MTAILFFSLFSIISIFLRCRQIQDPPHVLQFSTQRTGAVTKMQYDLVNILLVRELGA